MLGVKSVDKQYYWIFNSNLIWDNSFQLTAVDKEIPDIWENSQNTEPHSWSGQFFNCQDLSSWMVNILFAWETVAQVAVFLAIFFLAGSDWA